MKKILIISIFLLFLLVSCSQGTTTGTLPVQEETDYLESESGFSKEESQIISESIQYNFGLYYINHPIEIEYVKEMSTIGGGTTEMAIFYRKYEESWAKEYEKYKSLINEAIKEDPDLQEDFNIYIENWEEYHNNEVEFYKSMEISVHDTGTIVGPNMIKFSMWSYREQSLKLIRFYDELMLGRGWQWEYDISTAISFES